MKKYIFGILLILSLSVLIGCEDEQTAIQSESSESIQQKNTTTQSEKVSPPIENQEKSPFFWKVVNEDTTVYLLGSIHVGSEDMYPMSQIVEDAYESSDFLVVEANIFQEPGEMFSEKLLTKAVYLDGSLLSNRISQQAYEQLSELVSQHYLDGISMTELNIFKPWFVSMLLPKLMLSKEETINSQYGVDYHFLERATKDKKQILELEGLHGQMEFSSEMPEYMQIQQLEDSISFFQEEANADAVQQIIEVWKTGSEDQLAAFLSTENNGVSSDYEAYGSELMEKRNIKMVEKIKGYLTEGTSQTYFVVVGAGHYLDEIGLDNLLEKEFTVQSFNELN